MTASTKKPAIRISETRLEIVIEKRSLEAAKAIIAGNRSSLMASASMISPIGASKLSGKP